MATSGLLLLLSGCAKQGAPPTPRPVSRDPNLLVVYCACALQPEVERARDAFLAANEGRKVEITADEPSNIIARIKNGDVPDVVVYPGDSEVEILEQDGYLDRSTRASMGELRLVIVVPRGNPAQVHGVDDLANERVRSIAVSTPGLTSPGTGTKRELERAGLWSKLQEKLTMKSIPFEVLEAVSKGEVQVGILFDPCLRAGLTAAESDGESPTSAAIEPASLEFIGPLTAEENRATQILGECHKRSPNTGLAQRYLRSLQSQIESAQPLETPEAPGEPTPEEAP
jgi:ABC-type molybdate transport system substrate-binding protein